MKTMKQIQIDAIRERLIMFRGNGSKAAVSLGISHVTIYAWKRAHPELDTCHLQEPAKGQGIQALIPGSQP